MIGSLVKMADELSLKTIHQLQGDRVQVHLRRADGTQSDYLLTCVHVIDGKTHELRLVNRDAKLKKPDWHFSQKMVDCLKPLSDEKIPAKWSLALRV